MNVKLPISRLFSPLLGVLLFATGVGAQSISGQVVDQNGVGVPNVDLDVENLGSGGDPTISNGGTNAGGFFNVSLPAGMYRVIFTPPPPPVTTHLITEVDDVIVVGATNMGVIQLPAGVSLSGTVRNASGGAVPNVNLDIYDPSISEELETANDFTNALGQFNVAVPAKALELRLDTTPVVGQTLVSEIFPVTPSSNTNLGILTLDPGFRVSGTVRNSSGNPVEDVDIDVEFTATGDEVYTPGDNTSPTGLFQVIVPGATLDFQVCPQVPLRLVAQELVGQTIGANQNLGIFTLQSGVLLSGRVTEFNGAPHHDADIDVSFAATGDDIYLCGDASDTNGNYAVVVPTGTLDVRFSPSSFALPLGTFFRENLVVSGATTLNGALPSCPFAFNYGVGKAGSGGFVPHITSSGGAPSENNQNWTIEMEDGVGGGLTLLVLSLAPANIPFRGGTIWVDPKPALSMSLLLNLGGPSGVAGAGSLSFSPGALVGFAGLTGYIQFAVNDTGATGNWSLSEGMEVTFCP